MRLDHVGVVVQDLDGIVRFFAALGFEIGEPFEIGDWVDRIVGLEGTHAKGVYVSLPGGSGSLELFQFISPARKELETNLPSNALGYRHVAFQVEDMGATIQQVRAAGYDLLGEIVNHNDWALLAYVRGPEGLIIEFKQQL